MTPNDAHAGKPVPFDILGSFAYLTIESSEGRPLLRVPLDSLGLFARLAADGATLATVAVQPARIEDTDYGGRLDRGPWERWAIKVERIWAAHR